MHDAHPAAHSEPMTPSTFNPDTLAPVLRETFRQVAYRLPSDIAARLRPASAPHRHGSCERVVISSIHYPDLHRSAIEPDYFKYEHVHTPGGTYSDGTDWYLSFCVNLRRWRTNRDLVVPWLERDLRDVHVPGFQFSPYKNWIRLIHFFDFRGTPDQLVDHLVPRYEALIRAVHPVVMPVIAGYGGGRPTTD